MYHNACVPRALQLEMGGNGGGPSIVCSQSSSSVVAVITTCRRILLTSMFHTVVKRLIGMTPRGHPYRMPLVSCHHVHRAHAMRKAQRSEQYMAASAHSTPSSMPSSRAILRTFAIYEGSWLLMSLMLLGSGRAYGLGLGLT